MSRHIDLTGKEFGTLTVIKRVRIQRGYATWLCRCTCGAEIEVRGDKLRRGEKKDCNYWKHRSEYFTDPKDITYTSWRRMGDRCAATSGPHYLKYGARGIRVCERWKDFWNFVKDMGLRPSKKHSLDRIDNDKGYEPGNCRWATAGEQMRNTRRTIWLDWDGGRVHILDFCEETGINYKWAYYLAKRGLTAGQILNGERPDKTPRPPRPLSEEERALVDLLVAMRRSGASYNEIARATGLHQKQVLRRCEKYGGCEPGEHFRNGKFIKVKGEPT